MTFLAPAPPASQIASIQSFLSTIVPGLGRQTMEQEARVWKPTADRLVGAADSHLLFLTGSGPGYLYRRPCEPAGYFHLIRKADQSNFPNFELPLGSVPSARLIALHSLEKSAGLTATDYFAALHFLSGLTGRETEFFRLPSERSDAVFGLLAMVAGASGVFEDSGPKTLRERLLCWKRNAEDKVLEFLAEKMGWD